MDQCAGRTDEGVLSQTDNDGTGELKKKVRHRKKLLINRIRLQMEFYFNAANLSKDQFMNKLLSESPYIELKIFLTFNRVRALTEDVNLLQKAIAKSQILELSEDGLRVKRKSEVVPKDNELECTIYVENISSHVDHEWIHEVFSQYGTIDYVSFPHFKSTGRPKGFAFIEFETPQIADKALQAFSAFGNKMSVDMEPSHLQSVRTYEGNSYTSQKNSREIQSSELMVDESCQSAETTNVEIGDKEKNGKKKRKREEERSLKSKKVKTADAELEDDKASKSKKENAVNETSEIRIAVESEELGDVSDSSRVSKKAKSKVVSDKGKNSKEANYESEDAKGENADYTSAQMGGKRKSADEVEKKETKKCKTQMCINDPPDALSTEVGKQHEVAWNESSSVKIKKNKKKRKRNKRDKMESIEAASLKVMSKREWLHLRNKYLNIQRQNMKHMKEGLNIRKYENPEERGQKHNSNRSKGKTLAFIPNAVLKISFDGPPQDPRKLQETIREDGRGGVAYVETSPGEKDVYVRFHSAENAASYLKAGRWSRMILLNGEEEKSYWDHCIDVWQKKRNKKKFSQNSENRGKEKLLQRALREAGMRKPNAHIVFN